MMKNRAAILLIWVLLGNPGCVAVADGDQQRAVQEQNRQVYGIYQSYMKSLNAERELTGRPPLAVKSFEEWRQSPGTN